MTVYTPPRRTTGRSKEAARMFADLMAAPPALRRRFLAGLSQADVAQVLAVSLRETGTVYGLWADDPIGFITDVLGETMWSRPHEIVSGLLRQQRTAVPSCFSSSKTWTAARIVLHWSFTHPPGSAKAITMAPTWRQVVRLLWAEIRNAHSRAGLPGTVDQAQLKIPDMAGNEQVAAYGVSAAPWNEAAVQGIHSPSLLLVVDEAGGLGHTIGRNLRGMLSSQGSHMLAIGNPPTDEEESWFEGLCDQDTVRTIPISAYDTPALSGEDAPPCRSCHPGTAEHSVTRHLVTADWVTETIEEHGEDANYVQSKIYARFPKGGPSRAIPAAWIDAAADADEPEADWPTPAELGLEGERDPWKVEPGAWIRLGVDVAADGGDELAISRMVGDLVTMRHTSAGPANANSVDVAGVVLREVLAAQALAAALNSPFPVRVKVDGIGVGWGVAGLLKRWRSEGLHQADIVAVVVSEATGREPDSQTMRPYRKRDEMWLATRHLLEPRSETPPVRYRVDRKTLAQLRGPTVTTTSTGFTVVEAKSSMKKRGLTSPDRGESVLLAPYEPAPSRKQVRILV